MKHAHDTRPPDDEENRDFVIVFAIAAALVGLAIWALVAWLSAGPNLSPAG